MKYKDYKRLSKISLKARKKTTRSTVRGISFGLILLMPLLFIVIAFHLDLNKEVNKDASIRVFNISYTTKDNTSDEYGVYSMNEEYSERVYSIDGVESIVKYNQYTFDNKKEVWDSDLGAYRRASSFTVSVDGKIFSLDYHVEDTNEWYENSVGLQVIDTDVGDVFIKADKELTNNNYIIAGNEFSDNSFKEIMVSSNFIDHYNLNAGDVINKNITITYELFNAQSATTSKTDIMSTSLDAYVDVPITILKDYKIVGVYNSQIYKSEIRSKTQKEYYQENEKYETYFWVTSDSLYGLAGTTYLPEYIKIETEDASGNTSTTKGYFYNDTPVNMAKNARNNGKVYVPLGMGVKELNDGNNERSLYNTLIAFKSYADANDAVGIIESFYLASVDDVESIDVTDSYMSDTFLNYRMFYNIFTYVCIVLAIFGGVIFFATLLNLYNTIHYSVQSRRNYLGMIRAIGMKGVDVIKMYFIEIFLIFKRSYIWTIIFGGGICFGISMLFKMIMSSDIGAIITINLSLNPIYILVAFLMLAALNTVISIVFSLVACYSVSNKPILEVLVENR